MCCAARAAANAAFWASNVEPWDTIFAPLAADYAQSAFRFAGAAASPPLADVVRARIPAVAVLRAAARATPSASASGTSRGTRR